MTKAVLHAMTRHLAEYNIRINEVASAVVKTPIYEAFIESSEMNTAQAGFDDVVPIYLIDHIGSADDVAHTVNSILGDKAGWVTGAICDVGGGVMAGRS